MSDDKELDKSHRRFDYQERWHGWGSPVGLGIWIALVAAGLAALLWGLGDFIAKVQPPM